MTKVTSTEDVIQINDQWYVLATSSRADDRTSVLKYGETFGLFDRHGDIQQIGTGEQGLYHEGTRFLSHFELSINNCRPMLLNSTVKDDNSLITVDLTAPDLYENGHNKKLTIPRGTIHLFRAKLLWKGAQYEHIRLYNYGSNIVNISLAFEFEADYADIFEVRGSKRKRRGKLQPQQQLKNGLILSYKGLDGETRQSRILFSEAPNNEVNNKASFSLRLLPKKQKDFYITIACETSQYQPELLSYKQALKESNEAVISSQKSISEIFTSNEQFNDWINRSAADLHMLVTQTTEGIYPYAGVPWYNTAFGRDGIITALQYLWIYPGLARGVLNFLAATQAEKTIPEQDAEPGKILHETRRGEMAILGEVPFRQYYGSIDATPLFIMLAGAYYERTADRPFLEAIWPNIERALDWIDNYADRDGDGFIEYTRQSRNGLVQQGWKDSEDSIFHNDGSLAKGNIALCEVQGYVYEAKLVVARLAKIFGENNRAELLEKQADELKERFNKAFWCDEISSFALALDGKKRQCKVRSSNAGHCLFTGIANPEYARRTVETLFSGSSFNSWGIRTIAKTEANFNPMSYHNGSVWPHDNAIIAMGLARYGFKEKALKILTGCFNASIFMDLNRLPELFCGFEKLPGQGPTLYPVACSPQAWASGAVFYQLQACLGLSFSPEKPQLRFDHPQLPNFIERVQIKNLRVGNAVIDLAIRRHPNDVGINILRKEGDVEVTVVV